MTLLDAQTLNMFGRVGDGDKTLADSERNDQLQPFTPRPTNVLAIEQVEESRRYYDRQQNSSDNRQNLSAQS